MKPVLLLALSIMTIFSTTASTVNPDKTDDEGHSLSSLWKDYYKASRADKPQDEVSALEKIKKEALQKRLAWDFYDACEKYVSAKSSINWKLRSELKQQKESEVENFGSAVMSFYNMRKNGLGTKELEEFTQNNKAALLSEYTPEFCRHDGGINSFSFGEALPDLLSNDYEYALWSLIARTPRSTTLAEEYFKDTYPCAALIEYIKVSDTDENADEKISALENFTSKYSEKAVSMLSRQDLLRLRFQALSDSKDSESEDFISLKRDCEEFLSQRDGFKDDKEKALARSCPYPENLIEILDGEGIFTNYNDGILNIALRNLPSVTVKVVSSSEKTISEETIKNLKGSFYTLDTVSFTLPKLDDGKYDITLQSQDKKTSTEVEYSLYRLSLALKQNNGSHSVYVADSVTGEPSGECTLVLFDEADKEVARASVDVKGGFVPLPEELSSKIKKNKWGYSIKAEKTLRDGAAPLLSKEEDIYKRCYTQSTSKSEASQKTRATLITDRGTYNIGETAFFKTILYTGTTEFATCPAGYPVLAEFFDPSGNKLSSVSLSTNDFGSANGEFTLTKAEKGGSYRIRITDGNTGKVLTSTSVLADEFVLPTFSLSWNKTDRFCLPGDEVSVSGNVKAYSGHILGDAVLRYEVLLGSEAIVGQEVSLNENGDFSFSFNTLENKTYAHYHVRATVTDKSGETLEFSNYIFVSGRIDAFATIENAAEGDFRIKDGDGGEIITDDFIRLKSGLNSYGESGTSYPTLHSEYRIYSGNGTKNPILSGDLALGENDIPIKNLPSGLYTLETLFSATSEKGKEYEDKQTSLILKVSTEDKTIAPEISSFFLKGDGQSPYILTGSGRGGIIVAAELYDEHGTLSDRKLVRIGSGEVGTVEKISFPEKASSGSNVGIQLFYFRNREDYQYSAEFVQQEEQVENKLILDFEHFTDSAMPSSEYSVGIKTAPQTECAVSVFDVASEAFRSNIWKEIHPYRATTGITMPEIDAVCGVDEISENYIMAKEVATVRLTSKAGVAMAAYTTEAATLEEDVALGATDEAENESEASSSASQVRENFEKTLAWEPTLLSDTDGSIRLQFKTSDKLSTYRVQLFAHDKNFNNAVAKRDFTVTLPVKVSVVPPNILYTGDDYTAKVTLYNSTDKDIKGRVSLSFLNGKSKDSPVIENCSSDITVPAGGESEFACSVTVPDISNLGLLASFSGKSEEGATFSDALLESVSVLPSFQTITESHSALLHDGADRDSLIAELRGQFVNTDGNDAEITEISIFDMLKTAFKDGISVNSINATDLSSALYSDAVLSKIEGMKSKRLSEEKRAELISKILSCHNADGGFAWVEGFTSSPIVTAKLLERFSYMGENLPSELKSLIPQAVTFLDSTFFGKGGAKTSWYNCIGMETYLYVRSMYPSCKFETDGIEKTTLKSFRKEAKKYLTPSSSEGRKLSGGILSKVRRIKTLDALSGSSDGLTLASSFGIRLLRESKIRSSINRDIASLSQYAVEHSSGGAYFPNAVAGWGLMDSELSAHTAICDVLDAHSENALAENIRTWIMIQKETQQWETDPSYTEALACVLKAKPQTLALKVLALSARQTLPFEEIKPSGNGVSIEKEYRREDETVLNTGDTLHIGERISAVLKINNDENRSFVRVVLPFPGALRPVNQTSGICHSRQGNRFTGYMGYCNVRSDEQEYLFEAYPEFSTEIETEYFIVAEGVFSAPVSTIECLYAPHYRANDSYSQIISKEE